MGYGLSITEGISMSSSAHWRREVSKVPIPHMSVVHMFSNTENYAVVALYPVAMDFWSMPTHHMNAWEEGGEVVFDLACNPWDAMATYMDVPRMMNQSLSNNNKADFEMKRVRLRPFDRSVKVEDWPNARGIPLLNTLDFPMINNNYNGMKNRYAYGWASIDYWRQTLVKKDLEDTMNDKMWSQNSHYPGEVFFIPRPGAEAEDDGVLVTVVFDGEQKRSFLLLLDGQTFAEVNRSYLPFKVPFSFHGNWFPELH